jgi:hypothetical protein
MCYVIYAGKKKQIERERLSHSITQGLTKLLVKSSGEISPRQIKDKFHINIRMRTIFEVQPHVHRISVLYIFICGDIKYSLFYSAPFDNADTLHQRIIDACQSFERVLWSLKCRTVHGKIYPFAQWFKWRTSGTYVVNCDFIHNEKFTFIQLGKRITNILSVVSKMLHIMI